MTADEIFKFCCMIEEQVDDPNISNWVSRNWVVAERLVFGGDDDRTRDAIGLLLDRISDDDVEIKRLRNSAMQVDQNIRELWGIMPKSQD